MEGGRFGTFRSALDTIIIVTHKIDEKKYFLIGLTLLRRIEQLNTLLVYQVYLVERVMYTRMMEFYRLFLLFAVFPTRGTAASKILHTTLGPISGKTVSKTIDGGKVIQTDVYLGVPYAASTAGLNRFRSTQPRKPWTTTLSCSNYGPGCPQGDHNPDVPKNQSEDCLNLNIWKPTKVTNKQAMAIGIFFHGGAFKEGSNRGPFDLYDGAYFSARSGIIVIAANYRVGALGFLTSNDAGSEGNYGIQDQRMALKWVQANAKVLGGDPTKVTLWGESAGGMSGLIHMLSPASTGLFSRVIMESNPAGYIYRSVSEASDFGAGFVKDVGCLKKSYSKIETMKCLQSVNITTINKATSASNVLDVVKAVLAGAHLLDVFLPFTPTSGTNNILTFVSAAI
jgi:carboxylesterase type B